MDIQVLPLGAGQDVGRSCFIVSLGGKNIMFDCGMHMGFNDDRRFPDFSFITEQQSLTDYLDAVIISHFHLDHCGALPYMTEMVGFEGPIYMTNPTKAICPILLEDYRKISTERRGITNFFTTAQIEKCMQKVVTVSLHEVVRIADNFSIKAYYANHVLGAAMFLVTVAGQSVLYTGDYNMTPDRHLGAAWIDVCRPDLLITESTYATTIRDSKRCRERAFLDKVHKCVEAGGKVLIPVFALGRAQELCILLETYWERMKLQVPIYYSTGMTQQANAYYKLFISWTNEKIKDTFVERNMFEFKHIKALPQNGFEVEGPMVVFATPGMLHGGQSLQIFKRWAPNKNNMVILPGYCVAGTVGYKILNGVTKLEFDKTVLEVRLKVEYLSFSAHADAKGIMQLINQCRPRNVMLVHGESAKMLFLKSKIVKEFGLPCFMPANGEILTIKVAHKYSVEASRKFVMQQIFRHDLGLEDLCRPVVFDAALVAPISRSGSFQLLSRRQAQQSLGAGALQFVSLLSVKSCLTEIPFYTRLVQLVSQCLKDFGINSQLLSFNLDLVSPAANCVLSDQTNNSRITGTEDEDQDQEMTELNSRVDLDSCKSDDFRLWILDGAVKVFVQDSLLEQEEKSQILLVPFTQLLQSPRSVNLQVQYEFEFEELGSKIFSYLQNSCRIWKDV